MKFWKQKKYAVMVLTWMLLMLPMGIVAAQGEDEVRVGFFETYEIQPGSRVEVPVQIEDVQDLYGIDIKIKFDPEVIKIDDADPETEGTQPALGTFLDAGLTLFDTADNEEGVIRFVMSQVNPSEPKSGEGNILILYVQGLAEGKSNLEITLLELSTRAGEAISAEPVDGKVTVSAAAASKQSTSIPVQDPTSMVIVPTSQPTEKPDNTPTPTKTATPLPEETESEESETQGSTTEAEVSSSTTPTTHAVSQVNDADPQPTNTSDERAAAENTPNDQSSFTLVRYWWVVALVLVIALGLGGYLLSTRKSV
jgi:hypothetical protein